MSSVLGTPTASDRCIKHGSCVLGRERRGQRTCAAFKGEQHLLLIGATSDIASSLFRFCVLAVCEILKNP
jgi:hypothetical protein